MRVVSKTWWGQKFIETLESFTEPGRLSRGKAYRTDRRVKQWSIESGKVTSKIRGNANPYFGVYTEPTYTTTLKMTSFSASCWKTLIKELSGSSSSICKLMINEVPEDIEEYFEEHGLHLLPVSYQDFKVKCSCPDWEVPCKHIAGVCYRLAELLDHDPFLLFELRGLPRKKLHQELAKTELGKVLLQSLLKQSEPAPSRNSYFTRPHAVALPKTIDARGFWCGKVEHPQRIEPVEEAAIPALQLKKGGDYPQFWDKQGSFLDAMEKIYVRIRNNCQKLI